jgi:hypothetical protein
MISKFGQCVRIAASIAAVFLAMAPVKATVVDDFNDNVETGWSDFSFGVGSSTETGGQLVFNIPPAGQAVFAATTKTTDTYTLADGKTIELRADLVSGNSKDSFAILSWIPTSAQVSQLAGYSIAKSSTDILISKGINKYFHNENPTPEIKNDNVTLVLILTQKGTDVYITAKVLDKDANNAVLFEKTYVDTAGADILTNDGIDSPPAPYAGAGRLTLMEYEDYEQATAPAEGYIVTFDNAEAFVLENAVVDDFNDNTKTAWTDFTFGAGSSTETGGQFVFNIPPAGQALFFASTKTSRTYEFKDGEKIEFRVDLVNGNGKDSFAILSWIPNSAQVSQLAGYSIAKSTTDILISKGINKYFHNENPTPEIKNENVTLGLTLERRGTDVVINARVYDKDANNAVIFDKTYVDTAGADILTNDGIDSPAAPFTGPGRFVLMEYEDYEQATAPAEGYIVVFDNAWAAGPPLPANVAPTINGIAPENFRNFVAPTSTISFTVNDDAAVPASGVSVTLNGTKYTTANGLTVTPTGNTATASLGGLQANKNYTALIEVTDAGNVKASATIFFDTFDKNSFVVEAEDYNFGVGQFIDNPVLTPEGAGSSATSYRYQVGEAGTDYFSTYDRIGGIYRDADRVSHGPTLDFKRDAYLADGMVDYATGRIRTGEWQNYTRTFPAANYQIYLRESLFNVPTGEAVLEKVTGDPADPNATVEVLGSFIGANSGALYRNVPLTDATGTTPVVVHTDGVTTFRLRQVTPEPSDGNIAQNYLIFIPADGVVINRPRLVSLTPAQASTVDTTDLHVGATLQDRDTTVNTSTIELLVNDVKVTPAITTPTAGTTTIDYAVTPLPASGSTFNASLRYADSSGTRITNNWSFTLTYRSLAAANRVSSVATRGFNVRVTQAQTGQGLANSLQRAEDQLAPNSQILKAYDVTVTSDVINFGESADGGSGYFASDLLIPGLDSPDSPGTDDIAMEATAYLELPAGTVRFGVRSDDGYKFSAGPGLHDQTPVISFRNGGTADDSFDVLVPAAGYYPVRLLWYERGGSAYVEFYTVNPATGERTLINDPNTATAIKAYRELGAAPGIAVYSSATVDGTFTADATATVDANAKRITIPIGSGNRFYRVSGNVTLSSPAISSGNLTFTYQ